MSTHPSDSSRESAVRQQFHAAMAEHGRCGCSPVQPARRRKLDELIAARDEQERRREQEAEQERSRRAQEARARETERQQGGAGQQPSSDKPKPAGPPPPPDRVACSRRPKLQLEMMGAARDAAALKSNT